MKTTYEKFIEANNKLVKCFEAVSVERFQKLSHPEQDTLCHSERESVKAFLVKNEVSIANLVRERLEAGSHH